MWRILVMNPKNPHWYKTDGDIVEERNHNCIVDTYYKSLSECLKYEIMVVNCDECQDAKSWYNIYRGNK